MKKPADAVLALMADDEDEEAPDSKSGKTGKMAAGEELASALGLPDAKREAFLSALDAYLELC